MSRLSVAREIAFDALVETFEHRTAPDAALEAKYKEKNFPIKRIDKNLAKEIVFGTLRWWKKIYWILQHTSKRDLDKSPWEVKVALCSGAYQIYYLDRVPDRAAVSESAEYVRKRGQSSAVTFVNGILRQIARKAQYFPKPDKEALPVEYLSLQYSHPEWLVKRWLERFKFDRLSEMLATCNEPPPVTVRMNSLLTPYEKQGDLQTELLRQDRCHTSKRPKKGTFQLKQSPNFEKDSLFGKGYYTVQDEASQLIAPLLDPQPNDTIVESCAGPGGKLTHLAELSGDKAQITGVELKDDQFEKIRENVDRLNLKSVELVKSDFCKFQPEKRPNKILVDAPCSGLGVLRRHPEGRWLKEPDIIEKMVSRQKEILRHALEILEPQGELVYSVCSFEIEETLDQLKWLENTFGDKIELVPASERLQDYYKKYVNRDGVLIVYAGNQDHMDGFGAFIIRKKTEL